MELRQNYRCVFHTEQQVSLTLKSLNEVVALCSQQKHIRPGDSLKQEPVLTKEGA